VKVLVVEDDPQLAEILAEGLSEAGWNVESVADGQQAAEMALLVEYDSIVLDLMLPGRSGWEVCRALREQGRNTPILMLTARDAVEDKVQGLDAGADDYLTKPFAFPELLARLRTLLRRTGPHGGAVLRVADLEVDTVARVASRAAVPLNLTAREFALLEYLAYNAGRILTREQILAHVWPAHYDGMSNVVDVFVRYLRKKLGDDRELIRTVVGVGYTLATQSA